MAGKPAPVSPLAPAAFPDAAGDRRRALRRRRGRRALPGPARRDAGRDRAGRGDRRGLHPVRHPLGAGALVRGEARGAAGRGAATAASRSSSTPATPTPSPARTAGGGRGDRWRRRGGARHAGRRTSSSPRPGVIGEPLPAERIVAAMGALRDGLAAGRRRAGGARDHDHRHLPQGRGGHASSSTACR